MSFNAAPLHRWFRGRPGCEQIASAYACQALWWWLSRRQPRSILEIGGGIGCLSAVLALWGVEYDAEVSTVEDNPWCREQWRKNLPDPRTVRLCASIPRGAWDFIVVDGEQSTPALWTRLLPRAVVFVEGNRRDQRAEITRALSQMSSIMCEPEDGRPFCWAPWRPWDRSKGVWVLQVDPTPWERLWFLLVRWREWARDLPRRLAGCPVGKKRFVPG